MYKYTGAPGSVLKLVEPIGRGRGWHVDHRTEYRSRAHALVCGTKSPEARDLTNCICLVKRKVDLIIGYCLLFYK